MPHVPEDEPSLVAPQIHEQNQTTPLNAPKQYDIILLNGGKQYKSYICKPQIVLEDFYLVGLHR